MNRWLYRLSEIAPQFLARPGNLVWKELAEKVNQEILDDAYNRIPLVQSIYSSIGSTFGLEARTKKQQYRIEKKLGEVSRRDSCDQQYFKVVSDFIAFRVSCEVSDIPNVVSEIINISKNHGGTVWLKGNCQGDECDNCDVRHFTDIVQYVYVYIPQVEYVTEFQVGHPFAAYVFKLDSATRDNPAIRAHIVDLWQNNVYGIVKTYLLAQANNCVTNGMKYDALDAVHQAHEGNVPEELKRIIDRF